MDIDVRPCNMDSEGNKIFPRILSVNVKEASGIINELTNLHKCTLTRILLLHPELWEAIIFGPRIAQKTFLRKSHFLRDNIFSMFLFTPYRK